MKSVLGAQLPYVGEISNSSHDLGEIANKYLPLNDKDVLCIGLSEEEIDRHVARFSPRSITSLALWENHIDAKAGKYRVVIGDITRRTIFDDSGFDAVVTMSLLEHLQPLDAALIEMRRVTKRGGIIASIFGPVWSCAYGHHLYAINPQDPLLNFSLWSMPAFMHLLWTADEIRGFYLSKGYSAEEVSTVLSYMFEWEGISRAFWGDYMDAFGRLFQIEMLECMYNEIDNDLHAQLCLKFSGYGDFRTYGAKVVLRNLLK